MSILYKISRNVTSVEEVKRIQYICQSVGLMEELEEQIRSSRNRFVVAKAIKSAGVLRLTQLAPLIQKKLYEENDDLWLSSARSLVNMGETKYLIQFLLSEGESISNQTALRIGDILLRSNTLDAEQMIKYFDKASPLVKRIFIETLGRKKVVNALPLIEKCLDCEENELRIKAIKAIGDIGLTTKEDKLMEFLSHNHWVVRVSAIYAVQSCKIWPAVNRLIELLADENWWVRLRAAEALYEFGSVGKEKLQWAKQFHDDSFARDMAQKVLHGHGL